MSFCMLITAGEPSLGPPVTDINVSDICVLDTPLPPLLGHDTFRAILKLYSRQSFSRPLKIGPLSRVYGLSPHRFNSDQLCSYHIKTRSGGAAGIAL